MLKYLEDDAIEKPLSYRLQLPNVTLGHDGSISSKNDDDVASDPFSEARWSLGSPAIRREAQGALLSFDKIVWLLTERCS